MGGIFRLSELSEVETTIFHFATTIGVLLVCRRRHGESRTGGDTSGRSARRWEEWLFEEKEKKGKDRGGGKR